MKFYIVTLLSILATGCGGSSDSDSNNSPAEVEEPIILDCVIENDTITLTTSQTCNLTETDANLYSTPSDEISCNNGQLTYGSGTFSSADAGITFNGLTFICAAS